MGEKQSVIKLLLYIALRSFLFARSNLICSVINIGLLRIGYSGWHRPN